jgi:hypothetical protein
MLAAPVIASLIWFGIYNICIKNISLLVFLAIWAATFNALAACAEKSVGTRIRFII